MTNFKSLTIWTICLNFFILVGAGHGLACIGLLDVLWIVASITGREINHDIVSFSLTGSYDQSLGAVALLSFFGQVILLISFAVKEPGKFWIKLLALSFLWVAYYYLTHNLLDDFGSQLGLFSGIPFLICSGLLTYRMIKEKASSMRS